MTDKRYTIHKEFNGQPKKVWVLRFCGEYLAWNENKQTLKDLAVDHASDLRHTREITRIKNGNLSAYEQKIQAKINALNASPLLHVLNNRLVWGVSHAIFMDLEVKEEFGQFLGGGIAESYGWTISRKGKIYKRGLSYKRMINLLYAYAHK